MVSVEPWTFEQHLGEAVFIPAGCPRQVRNLKFLPKEPGTLKKNEIVFTAPTGEEITNRNSWSST
ncbi:putative transcription factor & chromatin remodeling &Metalloenzymes JmjC family [Helianthus debilis subsp. tardiflorus]